MNQAAVIEADALQTLVTALAERGYTIIGPTVRDSAIVYDEISSTEDLPVGWTDEQDGGTYRLKRREDNAYFGYAASPHSWKKYLHPPVLRLWSAARQGTDVQVAEESREPRKLAFFGVRSCDLNAIFVQDRVFTGGPYVDTHYSEQREQAFIVAVNCTQAGGTCFCASMGTGPGVKAGYDLAMTEVLEEGRHYFVVRAGSPAGEEVLAALPQRPARSEEVEVAEHRVAETASQMGRSLDTRGLKELLYNSYEHPRWEEVAQRCLTCSNCTMVCPTCFCTTVEDVTDLSGDRAERVRKWDSCFTTDFSYIHGGSVRQSTPARYRQWLTHKLATWEDQVGTLGCVGCGRCITWCPVGIDITEEARAIRENRPEAALAER
jgi:sulfhydrogenase subunit beta (sulfur reductase)